MRTIDGRLIANYYDNVPASITGSSNTSVTSSINENTTNYVLLPERINVAPYISSSIYNTSTPQIKPIQFNDPDRYNMFIDAQGVVKVAVGSSFVLRLKAKQPPIYNIENGVPTIYEDQTLLTYEWQKDGEAFSSQTDALRPNSNITVTGTYNEELTFTNVSPNFAGTYLCVVSNDIGSTESEQVVIEVYNPDVEDFFYRNLVDNPYGKDGLNGWQATDSEFIVSRLSDGNFKNFSQPWNTELFGYSKDMFYPRPYHLNTFHIRNSNLTQDLLQEGYYFTRENFKYIVKDGKAVVNASYDVDLTDVLDYVQGSIFGIEGVRAIFGCYIGNAITKFKTTLLNALVTKRNSKYSLLSGQIRLSLINSLLAGIPFLEEKVRVTVQEFDNETPLLSLINGNQQPGYTMYDPWNKLFKALPSSTTVQSTVYPNITVIPGSKTAKILYAIENNLLYPNPNTIPTLGQFVEFNKIVVDRLNFKTNKIRISISFETTDAVLNATIKQHVNNSDDCFEYLPWETIQKPTQWPSSENSLAKDGNGKLFALDEFNRTRLNASIDEPFKYATLLGAPRAMATGFNLVLLPIESAASKKLTYYTNNILEPLDDNLTYPILETGVAQSSPLGLYFQSISDYDYEIIGVFVENKYNQPTGINSEWQSGRGEIATRTSITTYKFNKDSASLYPAPLDFRTGVAQGYWQPFTLTSDPIFTTTNLSEELVVLYNSSSNNSILDSNIPQLVGILGTGLSQYSGISEIPLSYTTASTTKDRYISNIGIGLNLVGEDRGVAGNPIILNQIGSQQQPSPALTEARQTAWKTPTNSSNVNHYYRLLTTVDTIRPNNNYSSISNNYTQNSRPTQHIVYSKNMLDNFNTNLENKVNLGDKYQWQFTRNSALEAYNNTLTATATDTTYQMAIDTAEVLTLDLLNQGIDHYAIIADDGSTRNISWAGNPQVTTVRYIPSTETSPSYVRVTLRTPVNGSTADVVKLSGVTNNNKYSPSAIVIPSQQKIYYFLYNYQDNITGEL